MNAIIIGATGAVGQHIYQECLANENYSTVYVLGRKSIFNLPSNEKAKMIEIDFENINFDLSILENADVFCAFGTTLKAAGSKEKQWLIDYTYIVNFAQVCENKVRSFNLVSSLGANKESSVFYSRLKGELELALQKLSLGQLRIIRPSLLLVKRKELRIGEQIGIILAPVLSLFLVGKLKSYKPVKVEVVAKSMVHFALTNNTKKIYTYEDFIK